MSAPGPPPAQPAGYAPGPAPSPSEIVQKAAAQSNGMSPSGAPAVSPTVAPADHVLSLVSGCVVNQRAFANTCGVPLGAHMDFQPSSTLRLPQVAHSPIRCAGCGGFLNAYCKTNLSKYVWKCAMCGSVNASKEEMASMDIASYPELQSEAVEYVSAVEPSRQRTPPQAHLVVAVDTTLDPADLQAACDALTSVLDSMPPNTLLSLVTFDGCVAVHSLGAQRLSHVVAHGSASDQEALQRLLEQHCAVTAARVRGDAAGAAAGGGVLVGERQAVQGQLARALRSLRTVQASVQQRARARCLLSAVEVGLRLIAAHAQLDLARHHALYTSRVVVLAGGPPTRGTGALPLDLLDQAVSEKGRAPENKAVAAALDAGAALGSMASKLGVAVDIIASTCTGINAPLLTAVAHGSGGEFMPQQQLHLVAAYQPQHHDHLASEPGQGGPYGSGGGFGATLLARQLSIALSRRFGLDGKLDCYVSEGLRLVQWMGPLDALPDAPAPSAAPSSANGGPPSARAAAPPPSPYRVSPSACAVVAAEVGRGAAVRLELTRDLEGVPFVHVQVAFHFHDIVRQQRVVRVVTRRVQVVDNLHDFLRSVSPTAAAAMLGKRAVLDAKKAHAFRDSRKAEEARLAVAAQLALVAGRCGKEVQAGRGIFGSKRLQLWPSELMPLAYALYHLQRGPILGPPLPPPAGVAPAAAQAHLHALWDADARLVGMNSLVWSSWGDAYRSIAPKLYALLPGGPAAGQGEGGAAGGHQLAVLPCVTLAAVMARTVPLLLDCGAALLVSHTEEPSAASNGGAGPGGAADGGYGASSSDHAHVEQHRGHPAQSVPPVLLQAALQLVGASAALPASTGGEAAGSCASCRFPLPVVVLADGAQAGEGALAARLIPVQQDAYPEQALQHPQLSQLGQQVAAQLSKQLMEGEGAAQQADMEAALPHGLQKQARAAAASFVHWCRGVGVQPFPLSGR